MGWGQEMRVKGSSSSGWSGQSSAVPGAEHSSLSGVARRKALGSFSSRGQEVSVGSQHLQRAEETSRVRNTLRFIFLQQQNILRGQASSQDGSFGSQGCRGRGAVRPWSRQGGQGRLISLETGSLVCLSGPLTRRGGMGRGQFSQSTARKSSPVARAWQHLVWGDAEVLCTRG